MNEKLLEDFKSISATFESFRVFLYPPYNFGKIGKNWYKESWNGLLRTVSYVTMIVIKISLFPKMELCLCHSAYLNLALEITSTAYVSSIILFHQFIVYFYFIVSTVYYFYLSHTFFIHVWLIVVFNI